MARGRMISNSIVNDKDVNSISSDTSRLAFTWLIAFADREGRTYGDPALVRSMLFPRRNDVTAEQVESFIREWARLGLVVWYEAKGDLWISFPNFDRHQPGMRKGREPESLIPSPKSGRIVEVETGEELARQASAIAEELARQTSGTLPEDIRQTSDTREWNGIEEKRTEEKGIGADKPRKPAKARDMHFENLADVCRLTPQDRDWRLLPKTSAGQLNKFAAELRAVGATPEQIVSFGPWWYANDWRGKKAQPPKPADVVKEWTHFVNGANGANGPPGSKRLIQPMLTADEVRAEFERKNPGVQL